MRPAAALVTLLAAALLAAGVSAAPAQYEAQLIATVGPGFTISLRDASGARVTNLAPGTYQIEVRDLSEEHNFRLSGPGVNRATEIGEITTVTWTVTLEAGTYRYVCDPHAGTMNGSFTVGGSSNPPPSTPPSAAPITPKTKLQLTSGPGFTIRLRTSAGKSFRSMQTGTYTVTVRDRSSAHNAHVVAPGVNRATSVPRTGTQTWKVKLAKAGTFRFLCDPHSSQMKGSAKIVR